MEKQGLTNDVLVSALTLGLLQAAKFQGSDNDFIEIPGYATRHRYLETALKLKKLLGANADAAPVANFFQFIPTYDPSCDASVNARDAATAEKHTTISAPTGDLFVADRLAHTPHGLRS